MRPHSIKLDKSRDGDITGAAMDTPLKRRPGKRVATTAGILFMTLAGALLLWQAMPRGLQVSVNDIRIATVERGLLRDDVVVRAQAVPLTSVLLDAVESGRVEEVFARDGAIVKKDDLLFRLSNPQRQLDLLARQSERAQQISNLANLRVALEASRAEHRRRLSDLSFAAAQVEKQHARNVALADKGFVSSAVLEESADLLVKQRRALDEEMRAGATDIAIKRNAIKQMDRAIADLESGLKLVHAAVDSLKVRAPAAGRLTDFDLHVGETVRLDRHLGRIDDPVRFKLSAKIYEYYLSRITVGQRGSATINGKSYAVDVSSVYTQIKEGRFTVELTFSTEQPASLSPGQSMDTCITLGESRESLLLPNAAFLNDSGGAWVFVLTPDGTIAERRAIRVGRRNNSQVEVLSGLAPGERVIVSSYVVFGKAERLQLVK